MDQKNKEEAASSSSNGHGNASNEPWPPAEIRSHNYMPAVATEPGGLRPVIIDGSNVAMQLGKKIFSTRGILICARYFISLGHRVITFVPFFRRNQSEDNFRRPMKDQFLLNWMHQRDMLVFSPSRTVTNEEQRRRVVCYDDFFIVRYAHETGGVIVSKDQYRDVLLEQPEWGDTIRNRVVMFSWAGEMFMPAEDPFGRRGMRLKELLRFGINEPAYHPVAPLWSTDEERKRLLREIDEVLASPPPPPQSPFNSLPSSFIRSQAGTSITDLAALSVTPRMGFARNDQNSNYFGFNHRSRGWMRDLGPKNNPSSLAGFGPVNTNGWGRPMEAASSSQPQTSRAADTLPPRDNEGDSVDDPHNFMEWFSNGTNGYRSHNQPQTSRAADLLPPRDNEEYSADDPNNFMEWFPNGTSGYRDEPATTRGK